MAFDISKSLVKDSSGLYDVGASLKAVALSLTAENDKFLGDIDTVSAAVNSVFDQYRGAAISMSALQTFSLGRLSVSPAAHTEMKERVASYVKANLGTLFTQAKGKGGGVRRIADQPVSE
jgi:hypothetical protein